MKKEVFLIVLAFSIIFVSSCTNYPGEIKYSPSGYIDHFDLGEDATSHDFNCEGCSSQTIYDCNGDQRIRMRCGSANYVSDYIEFKMIVARNQDNILLLQTGNSGDVLGYKTTKFKWFINGESQNIMHSYAERCSFLELEIPARYTLSGKITLRFENVLESSTSISCSKDFAYTHAYMFDEQGSPDIPEPECHYDEDCPNGYCMFPDCVEGCTIDNHCVLGYVCDTTTNNCIEGTINECISDTGCPTYYICENNECILNPGLVCFEDSDCEMGYICENYNCVLEGIDEPTNTSELTDIPCITSQECQGNLGIYYGCVEGFCAIVREPCDSDIDCPNGQVCAYYRYCKNEQIDYFPEGALDDLTIMLRLEKGVFEPNEPITLK
ncbi:MAG: hypothetical protein ABIJ20_02205 [Nanoarchaeota archaeon]|nr:hypothetical protein [Nanoarchaeota archaeon]MBU1445615.1 hypothetical protein [Nanoarchaeota archaeon]MBU2406923.1 hypothetical protein [Nanoarchaeota archaeon]MBU2420807.1 hypothetical protein [Nanoarchaeota archaeon]MBU2475650.1 hypothetical protein [Nanoarchaeota archaeon]